jgi:hypothetical protein
LHEIIAGLILLLLLSYGRGSIMQNITDKSLALFLEYARDAGNWSGTPLVGGNVGGSKEDCGNLTQLKKAGLVVTEFDSHDKNTWLMFTQAGRDLARDHGITIENCVG